jgi:hypothetical protein
MTSGAYLTTNAGSTGVAQVLAALNDASDTTYVYNNANPSLPIWTFRLGIPSIGANDFVARTGSSFRYTQAGTGSLNQVFLNVRRPTDAQSFYASPWLSQNASATQLEVGLASSSWAVSDLSVTGMYLDFQPYRGQANVANILDIWATYYTLTRATATVTATTMTTSSTPTIPITVNTTIDWETTASDSSGLRKHTVEVRVESGGSGVGTGTLVSYVTTNVNIAGSGVTAQTVNAVMPDALPNGSYNVYARVVRYREGQASYVNSTKTTSTTGTNVNNDQIGAWSSVATLTMNNPLPTVPTVSITNDPLVDQTYINVTPIATSGHSNPTVDVQRSVDSGNTYTAVRNATGVAVTFGVQMFVRDDECPRNNGGVLYRVRVNTTYTGGLPMSSQWFATTAPVLPADTWNLKVPESQSLNIIDAQIVGELGESITEDVGVFRPLDRRYPVVVAGALGGWDGDLTIVTVTANEWTYLKAVLEAQKVILLESPFGWSKYIRITSGAKVSTIGSATAPKRTVTVSYVETSAP